MLKVLLVYYEPRQSGQTTHVLSLVKGLDRSRYDISVILPNHLEKTIETFRQAGVRVYPLSMRKILWKPDAIIEFLRLAHQEKFDILHVHSQEAGLITRVLTPFTGVKRTIYTPQTIDIHHVKWHWLYIFFERILSNVTDKIISVNKADRKRLLKWGIPAEKVVIIPNSIDLKQFNDNIDTFAVRSQLGLNEHNPVVMQVGRLSTQKAPCAFVDGAYIIAQEHPDVQFVMVGDGPLEDKVRGHIKELGMSESIKVVGWYDNAFELISSADIVTLTSRWEGTPFSLLEAMAWSKPVIATKVNGCSEMIIDGITGFLVPPGDINAWSSRVIELLNKPELAKGFGQLGNERVNRFFSKDIMVNQIESLYNQVACEKH
jgi:glycosyltransferase involved in cell wall biosynthesis